MPTQEEINAEKEQTRKYEEEKERIRLEKERIKSEHAFSADSTPSHLIIPDVHGRLFWKEAIEQYPNLPVVFLGDYLDPYCNHLEDIKKEDAIDRFLQILEYKHKNPERVTLLLGNHDLHYFCEIDCSRKDIEHKEAILEIFKTNFMDFKLAEVVEISNRSFLISHAGVLPGWLDLRFENISKKDAKAICNAINECFFEDPEFKVQLVRDISGLRGGTIEFGSPVWADVKEHEATVPFTNELLKDYPFALPDNIYQIFGHSQQEKDPIYRPHFCCLDCRRAFILCKDGHIMELEKNS